MIVRRRGFGECDPVWQQTTGECVEFTCPYGDFTPQQCDALRAGDAAAQARPLIKAGTVTGKKPDTLIDWLNKNIFLVAAGVIGFVVITKVMK
jgi:hypothetical protein